MPVRLPVSASICGGHPQGQQWRVRRRCDRGAQGNRCHGRKGSRATGGTPDRGYTETRAHAGPASGTASPWTAGAGPRPAGAWCGDGLGARRRAGALPGDGFLVAPAADRTNPGPPELIAPDEERRTGTSARSVPAAREFERRCQGTPSPRPDARVPGPACSRDAGGAAIRPRLPFMRRADHRVLTDRGGVARWSARRVLAPGCGGW